MGRIKQKPEESAKRALILAMADKMFICHGYSAISMDALADAVPVSKRTLYNHFKDKRALFVAVMQTRCQHVYDRLEQSLQEGKSPEQVLTDLGQMFLSMVLNPDSVNIYRTMITEAQHFPDLGKLFFESGPKRAAGILGDYLKKLDEQGVLRVPHPEQSAHFFFGMLKNRPQMQCLLGLKPELSKKEQKQMVAYAVDVFLRGHRPI